MDIALRLDTTRLAWDLACDGADLRVDDTLETAVIVSLFSDARALDSDIIPDGTRNRRGWWADRAAPRLRPDQPQDRLGSHLWLLGREKQIPAVLLRLKAYAAAALAWMVEDGLAAAVTVDAGFPRLGWAWLGIVLTRGDGGVVRYGYNLRWGAAG